MVLGVAAHPDKLWDVRFVRGTLTAKKLGLNAHQYITDPAILLAKNKFTRPVSCKAIGYIPHHTVANMFRKTVCQRLELTYIDPRRSFNKR